VSAIADRSAKRDVLPRREPLLHATDMASWPIQAAAIGAHQQRTAGGARPCRHSHRQLRWRRFEQAVVDEAAGERRMLPVDVKSGAQTYRGVVNPIFRDEDGPRDLPRDRKEMPVSGKQDTILFGAACSEHAVGHAAFGDDRVITGGAQPPTETREHFVAKEPHRAGVPIMMASSGPSRSFLGASPALLA
jgi:hypothetical protein